MASEFNIKNGFISNSNSRVLGTLTATTLNLQFIGSGTSVNNLGIDIYGNIVSGVTTTNNDGTFTGGTVTGSTIFTNGLSANTVSATTYYNLPIDVFLTGGTYSATTSTIIFTNNTGGTFNVTGITISTPTILNKSEVVTATTINNDFNTGIIISGTPIANSYVGVSINGLNVEVGDGVTIKDCYFSSNGTSGGVRNFSAITSGDYFMWNTTISDYDLDSTDIIAFYYNIMA